MTRYTNLQISRLQLLKYFTVYMTPKSYSVKGWPPGKDKVAARLKLLKSFGTSPTSYLFTLSDLTSGDL